ncbi:hypothetical protein HUA74_05300 [Myxococcus sp. CA051A]|uniref:Uncharacterized protein n=1 Tax=Myxococcus llanfairpwllgwyngyllgogerychwyrndrobwllllantysiliogogogochensis TaxID=2590453 RepID=A0A540WPC2_9BACT|nr:MULTISPECIES: hypothetical protein [Myxococcus]NTX15530.1 hypothetical protein [Myxococcus sp. CA056]NTX32864.1 hypothetical protein [Myxococcus sp. CA033]NTX56147.1 hypothetical protein [Myxococcus sp. CA039A]NTX60070.1 hypothetical protein [Myxococcus sp. CA051A]TQF10727.1 hypothetical protein FJV41_37955 [Myxococcus llanfairpwllgwyngyllgogerychwyrndrobwllllantysiliogogogochensis]
MSLLPESASFEELVQDYFLAVRGAGLMLSALDSELLTSWAREGVPFEVVARGISRSAEKALWDARPGEPVLRNLRACRRQVDAEIKKYRSLTAGAGETPAPEAPSRRRKALSWEETRHARLVDALEDLAGREQALAPRVAWLRGTVLASIPGEPAALDAQEALSFLALLRALPFLQRREVWRDALSVGSEQQVMSVRARRLSRRFRVVAAVRRRLGVKEV